MAYKIINEIFSFVFSVLSLWSQLYFIHEHFSVWTSRVSCAPKPGTATAVDPIDQIIISVVIAHMRWQGTWTRNRGKQWLKGAEESQGNQLGSCSVLWVVGRAAGEGEVLRRWSWHDFGELDVEKKKGVYPSWGVPFLGWGGGGEKGLGDRCVIESKSLFRRD